MVVIATPPGLRGRSVAGLPAGDVALAGILGVIAVGSAATDHPDLGPVSLTVPVAAAMTLALAWRTAAPLVAAAIISVASLVQAVLANEPGTALWGLVVYLVIIYSVSAHSSEGRAAVGGVLVTVDVLVQERINDGVDYVFIVVVFGAAWLLGRAVNGWSHRAVSAEQQRDVSARLAVAEERVRIARELHDVVAHGLSVIAVQADAAEAALAHDPQLAVLPLRAVNSSARSALREMRQMLDLLRTEQDDDPRLPQPRLAQLPELVETMRGAGLPVQVQMEPDVRDLPPGLDLSAYRIVQEALTNVLKHAGLAPTTVTIRRRDSSISIAIRNTAGPPAPASAAGSAGPSSVAVRGHGLIGIAERAAALGGTASAGQDANGFLVQVRMPILTQDE